MRKARVSVNALLLEKLLGIGWGTVRVLREMDKVGQADGLEERMVAIEESRRPAPESVSAADVVPIQADVWRRIKAATGYGSFECDEHVAQAIEGLLKETRIAMPYAHELEDMFRALAPLAGIPLEEHADARESWREFVQAIGVRIAGLEKERDDTADLANGLGDEIERIRKAIGAAEEATLLSQIEDLVAERALLRTQYDEARTKAFELNINLASAERKIDRLNAELDAMAQRAVMPTFEPEPEGLEFLDEPLAEAEPAIAIEDAEPPAPVDVPIVVEEAQPVEPEPAQAPEPAEPEAKPADLVPAPKGRPGRKKEDPAPVEEPKAQNAWNLYASPEQAVAIARMAIAGASSETISKELDARPADVEAVRLLISQDIIRVRKMLPMQRERWLEVKGKAWRAQFNGASTAEVASLGR